VHRLAVRTSDGRRFRGPLIEDDSAQQESFDQFQEAVIRGELPDWLPGVEADELATWGIIPGPRYKPRTVRPSGSGAVKVTVAVWPDARHGYMATPVGGPAGGNAHGIGKTEEQALVALANILDVLRDRPFEIKSNLPPEVVESLKTDPAHRPGVRYFRVEVERGNRFEFDPIETPTSDSPR
jgi:hypothetical protein